MTSSTTQQKGWPKVAMATPGGGREHRNTPQNPKMDQFAKEKADGHHNGGWPWPPLATPSGDRRPPPLSTWLNTLRERDITLVAAGTGAHLAGNTEHACCHDNDTLDHYAHALQLAATGTHPAWWEHVCGRRPAADLTVDDIPWQCVTCGDPDVWLLNDHLEPTCHTHTPETHR